MGTKIRFLLAGGLALGVIAAAGVGFLVGRETDEGPEMISLASTPAIADGADTVNYQPLPAGDPDRRRFRPSSRAGWRTNEVRIHQEQAEEIARARFQDARALHAELDEDDGYFLWEVLLQRADGTYLDVVIDAGDGRVVGIDYEDGED
jgi:uncharacterized membrane protein YkoI